MQLHRAIVVSAALALVTACGGPTAVSDGAVTAQHRNGQLELRNGSNTPVYYFVVERQTAAVINWAPCVSASCPSAAAGAQIALPDSSIPGLRAGASELVVYWWRAVLDTSGRLRPDSIRQLVVPLQ